MNTVAVSDKQGLLEMFSQVEHNSNSTGSEGHSIVSHMLCNVTCLGDQ